MDKVIKWVPCVEVEGKDLLLDSSWEATPFEVVSIKDSVKEKAWKIVHSATWIAWTVWTILTATWIALAPATAEAQSWAKWYKAEGSWYTAPAPKVWKSAPFKYDARTNTAVVSKGKKATRETPRNVDNSRWKINKTKYSDAQIREIFNTRVLPRLPKNADVNAAWYVLKNAIQSMGERKAKFRQANSVEEAVNLAIQQSWQPNGRFQPSKTAWQHDTWATTWIFEPWHYNDRGEFVSARTTMKFWAKSSNKWWSYATWEVMIETSDRTAIVLRWEGWDRWGSAWVWVAYIWENWRYVAVQAGGMNKELDWADWLKSRQTYAQINVGKQNVYKLWEYDWDVDFEAFHIDAQWKKKWRRWSIETSSHIVDYYQFTAIEWNRISWAWVWTTLRKQGTSIRLSWGAARDNKKTWAYVSWKVSHNVTPNTEVYVWGTAIFTWNTYAYWKVWIEHTLENDVIIWAAWFAGHWPNWSDYWAMAYAWFTRGWPEKPKKDKNAPRREHAGSASAWRLLKNLEMTPELAQNVHIWKMKKWTNIEKITSKIVWLPNQWVNAWMSPSWTGNVSWYFNWNWTITIEWYENTTWNLQISSAYIDWAWNLHITAGSWTVGSTTVILKRWNEMLKLTVSSLWG